MQGLKQKKNPEPELFSRVGGLVSGWIHTQGYLANKKNYIILMNFLETN